MKISHFLRQTAPPQGPRRWALRGAGARQRQRCQRAAAGPSAAGHGELHPGALLGEPYGLYPGSLLDWMVIG